MSLLETVWETTALYISTGDVVVGNGAIHISTGDGMVGHGVVDTYCEGY